LNEKKAFNSISTSFKTQAKKCGIKKEGSRNIIPKANTYTNKRNILAKVRSDLEAEWKKELAVDEKIQLQTVHSQRDVKASAPKVQILPSLVTPKELTQQKEQVQGSLCDSTFEEIDMRSGSSIEVSQEENNLTEVKKKLNEIAKQMRDRTIKRKISRPTPNNNISKLLNMFFNKASIIMNSEETEKEQLNKLKTLILNTKEEYNIIGIHKELMNEERNVHKKYQIQIEKIRKENNNLKNLVSDIEASIIATGTNTAEEIKAPVVKDTEILKEHPNDVMKELKKKKKKKLEKSLLNELSKRDKEIKKLQAELEAKDKEIRKLKSNKGKSEVISKKIQEKFANQVAVLNSVIKQKSADTSKNTSNNNKQKESEDTKKVTVLGTTT